MIESQYLLRKHKFLNLAPHNPTQTRYERFRKKNLGSVLSQFTDTQERVAKIMDNALVTRYTPLLTMGNKHEA